MRRTTFSLTILLVATFSFFVEQASPAETVSRTGAAPDSPTPERTTETSALAFDIDVHVILNNNEVAEIDPTLRINKLHLAGNHVTNASLDEVRLLAGVNLLSIEGTKITNAGLGRLKGMTNLRSLRLWNRNFTDSALVHLQGLPKMESLDLEGTSVQGTTLAQLGELPALRTLILSPYVDDEGLEALRSLIALEELDLRACHHITEAGLKHLEGLKNLRLLWLPVQITELGELRLRRALPKCDVRR